MNCVLMVVRLFTIGLLVAGLIITSGCSGNSAKSDEPKQNSLRRESPGATGQEQQPDTAQILALADAAYRAQDWETAEKHYVEITRAIPKEAHTWFRLGNIYARTDRPDFAVAAYKEALLRDPELTKAWYNMGLVQLRQSANSFLQMRTYSADKSEAQVRADTMYEATIGLIKEGPKRAKVSESRPTLRNSAPTADSSGITSTAEDGSLDPDNEQTSSVLTKDVDALHEELQEEVRTLGEDIQNREVESAAPSTDAATNEAAESKNLSEPAIPSEGSENRENQVEPIE